VQPPSTILCKSAPLMSWHPVRLLCAVACTDDVETSVCFYSDKWESGMLRHDFMKDPSCMEWAPLGEIIALGCGHGVCLWRAVGEDMHWWMTFLQHPNKRAISHLSWSSSGRHLATSSVGEKSILVWDIALRTCQTVMTPYVPHMLAWSVSGFLFSAFKEDTFSVFETGTWGSETFDFPGTCRAASWTPNGYRIGVVMDNLERGDRVWVCSNGSDWMTGTVVNSPRRDSKQVEVNIDAYGGNEEETRLLARETVHGDKPVFVGTLQAIEDTPEFSMSFESAFLPSFDTASLQGSCQLPSSKIVDISWNIDGSLMLVAYFLEEAQLAAVTVYTVRHEPLSFAPLSVIDLRAAKEPPKCSAFWSSVHLDSFVAAAAWGQNEDMLAESHSRDCGLTLYRT
jgi:WD40 repeat protein